MKEAAGEANLTVITIVLIAIVLAVGTVIVNSALNSMNKKSACTQVNGIVHGARCYYSNGYSKVDPWTNPKTGETLVNNSWIYSCSTSKYKKGYYVRSINQTIEQAEESMCVKK